MFEKEDIVFDYSDEQAIDDGVLVDLRKFSRTITKATSNLLDSMGYIKEDMVNVANLMDLIHQCVNRIAKDSGKDWFYKIRIEFPDGSKGFVFCAGNEDGRYTVMLPEDY